MEKMKMPISPFTNGEYAKAEEEAVESLRKNETVYETIKNLGLTKGQVKQFLGPLLDLKDDSAYCVHCPGLENCGKDNPQFVLKLELDGDLLERHYDHCPRFLEEEAFRNRYIQRDFPKEWIRYDLYSIDKSKKRNAVILAMISILEGQSERWLYLTGGKKSGKSVMLACFANSFALKRESPVAFVSSVDFFDSLKNLSFQNKAEFEKKFNLFKTCPLLVLDGFGNEFVSDYNFSTFLFPLLLSRSKENLLTCFTSTLSIEEVCSLYGGKIGSVRGKQLLSLLKDYCVSEFDVSGSDLY